jgi:hypothetical protein
VGIEQFSSFQALMSVPKVIDDMRKPMVDFPDDYRPIAYPRSFLNNTKQPLWFLRMVPDRPMERDLVHMFLVCDRLGIACTNLQFEALRIRTISVKTHSVIYECKDCCGDCPLINLKSF